HAVELQGRLPRDQVRHFKILPPDPVTPPRPDRLHSRFFGREARRVPLELVGLTLHVGDLPRRVNALDEFLPEPLNRRFDARHFRQINSCAHDHFSPAPDVVIVSRPCFTPFVLISTSAIFRTAADLPFTIRTSRQLSWSRCT